MRESSHVTRDAGGVCCSPVINSPVLWSGRRERFRFAHFVAATNPVALWPAEAWLQRAVRGACVGSEALGTRLHDGRRRLPRRIHLRSCRSFTREPPVTRRPSLQMKVRRHLSTAQAGEGGPRCSDCLIPLGHRTFRYPNAPRRRRPNWRSEFHFRE